MNDHPALKALINRYPELESQGPAISEAASLLVHSFRKGNKLLLCGNGGSASDTNHLVGELVKSFEAKRPLPTSFQHKLKRMDEQRGAFLAKTLQQGVSAISLASNTALLTAISNDLSGDLIYAQQIMGYGQANDVLLAISSSGNSQNVLDALLIARAKSLKTIGLTGETGGQMAAYCDVIIRVPANSTRLVQEYHLPVYHTLCLLIESELFGADVSDL